MNTPGKISAYVPHLGTKKPGIDGRLYFAGLTFIAILLLIDSLFLRAILLLSLGILIYAYERRLGLPVPATPGTLLWLGSFTSYVVGGIGSLLLDNALIETSLATLPDALLYLGLGIVAYGYGLCLVGIFVRPIQETKSVVTRIFIPDSAIIIITILFIVPVIGKNSLGGGSGNLYDNLVIGGLQSIESLPVIIFAFYMRQKTRHWWLTVLLLIATMAIPFQSLFSDGYGRSKLIFAFLVILITWLALVVYSGERISGRFRLFTAIVAIGSIIIFGIGTSYRALIGGNQNRTTDELVNILGDSFDQVASSNNIIDAGLGPFVNRLIEEPSLELLGWLENEKVPMVGWNWGDTQQVLLAWIPKTFYSQKGEGYGRDIMVNYGLSSATNNIPITILTDSYRRYGVFGVLFLYFFMGVASTTVVVKLIGRWHGLGFILVIYFALQYLTLYSQDTLAVFTLYDYRFISSSLVITAFLWITNCWHIHERTRNPGTTDSAQSLDDKLSSDDS